MTELERLRAALEAIANAEIPGVSGGPNGASVEVAEFARRALADATRATDEHGFLPGERGDPESQRSYFAGDADTGRYR